MGLTLEVKRGYVLFGCWLGLFIVHALSSSMLAFIRTYEAGRSPDAPSKRLFPDMGPLGFPDGSGAGPVSGGGPAAGLAGWLPTPAPGLLVKVLVTTTCNVLFVDFYYFIGGVLGPLPVGYLALNFSAGFLFGGLLLVGCVLNLLVATGLYYDCFSLLRVISFSAGVIEAALIPVVFSLLITWTTDKGRTRQVAMVMSANYLGDLSGQVTGAYMLHLNNYAVHVFSMAGFLVLFYWVAATNAAVESDAWAANVLPDDHYEAAMSGRALHRRRASSSLGADPPFVRCPWRHMLHCRPLIALVYATFVFYLLYYSSPLVTALLGFAACDSVVMWVLPQIVLVLTAVMGAVVVVCTRRSASLSATRLRRLMICAGLGLEAIFLVWISASQSRQLALIFLTMGVGFSGWTLTSLLVNPMELAPNHASLVAAITSTASHLAGLLAKTIFYHADEIADIFHRLLHPLFVALSILISSAALLYGYMGSSDAQDWDENSSSVDASRHVILHRMPTRYKTGTDLLQTTIVPQQTDYLKFEFPE